MWSLAGQSCAVYTHSPPYPPPFKCIVVKRRRAAFIVKNYNVNAVTVLHDPGQKTYLCFTDCVAALGILLASETNKDLILEHPCQKIYYTQQMLPLGYLQDITTSTDLEFAGPQPPALQLGWEQRYRIIRSTILPP